jgi:single-strand DNA-binding protein
MEFILQGTITKIFDTETFQSGFCKREFVITTSENYPQKIKFEFVKEKTSLLDKYQEGDSVEVAFNIRGSEYNDKFYVNLGAWRIKSIQGTGQEASRNEPSAHAAATLIPTLDEDDGGIPF